MMPYGLYQPSRPWKLSLWQLWPFPRAHSTTRFQGANDWAELCLTAQLSWTVQSWCCSRYPQWQHQLHLQTHSHVSWRPGNNCSWGPLSFQTLRQGVNLHLDFGGTSILISHTRSRCCRATSSPGITFTSVTVSLHMFAHGPREIDGWSYGKGWRLSARLPFPTCMWWDGCHFSWNMRSQEAGWLLGHSLG